MDVPISHIRKIESYLYIYGRPGYPKIRSSYVHHGKIGENWEILEQLQHLIWTGIRNILISKESFNTQKDFLDQIEELILT